jgi:hypothetical protein
MSYKLADGTVSTDYKVGDKFTHRLEGDRVYELLMDDGTMNPLFKGHINIYSFPRHWSELKAHCTNQSYQKEDDTMIFTIRGKEFTKFDINRRCAELLGIKVSDTQWFGFRENGNDDVVITSKKTDSDSSVDYCKRISDTEVIIDKCFNNLMSSWCTHLHYDTGESMWLTIIEKHNCCKLVAACIFFIMESDNE